jgi:hypothetical protein
MIVVVIAPDGEAGCTIVLEAWKGTGSPAAFYAMTEVAPTVYESPNITGLNGEFRVRMRNAANEPVYTGYVTFHGGARGQADDQPVSLDPDPVTPIPSPGDSTPETVASQMSSPASITVDGVTVQNRSIPDMIAAEQHQAANAAASKGAPFGIGFAKFSPGSGRGT